MNLIWFSNLPFRFLCEILFHFIVPVNLCLFACMVISQCIGMYYSVGKGNRTIADLRYEEKYIISHSTLILAHTKG